MTLIKIKNAKIQITGLKIRKNVIQRHFGISRAKAKEISLLPRNL